MTPSILIVDDDTAILNTMFELVEIAGYNPTKAATAEEALKILEKKEIDVVITDIMLPGMNGLELTDKIKSKYDTEVIVITGYSGEYSYEEAIKKGASDFVFKPIRFEELLLRLKRVLKERKLSKERTKMLEKLQELAITDDLTRLHNSRHFFEQINLEVGRTRRYKHPLSLLLLDIDDFKFYNDKYGHLEGDNVLWELGQAINACLRTNDSAYRYGGEEFTVILPETECEEALTVAHRLTKSVQEKIFTPTPEDTVNITISTGVTEYIDGEEISELIKRADKAMYLSKRNGKNRVSILSG